MNVWKLRVCALVGLFLATSLSGFSYVNAASPSPSGASLEPPAEYGHGSTFTELSGSGCQPHCGRVLITGGLIGGGRAGNPQGFLAAAILYDPIEKAWSSVGSLRRARAGHQAILLSGPHCGRSCGQVLVLGGVGRTDDGGEGRYTHLTSAELFDPKKSSWSRVEYPWLTSEGAKTASGDLVPPLPDHTALLTEDNCGPRCGQVLAVSGETARLYNPGSKAWGPAKPPLTSRIGAAANVLSGRHCGDHCGKVVVAGGMVPGPKHEMSSELYDPAKDTWVPAGAITLPARFHRTVQLAGGSVLVAGGEAPSHAYPGPYSPLRQPRSQLFDPKKGTWTSTGALRVNPSTGVFAADEQAVFAPLGQVVNKLASRDFLFGLSDGSALAFGNTNLLEQKPDGSFGFARSEPDYSVVQRFEPDKKDSETGAMGAWEIVRPLNHPSANVVHLKCTTPETVLAAGQNMSSPDPARAAKVAPDLYLPGDNDTGRQVRRAANCGSLRAPENKSAPQSGRPSGQAFPLLPVAVLGGALVIGGAALGVVLRRRRQAGQSDSDGSN